MTDSVLVLPPGWRATDANDSPIPGAKLKFFSAGTTTPVSVYSDQGLATVLGSTVTCDAGGYPVSSGTSKTTIYTGTASYKLRLTDADDATVWEHDNLRGALSIPTTAAVTIGKTPVISRTSNVTIVAGEQGRLINADPTGGSFVLTLPDASTVAHVDGVNQGDGWKIGIRHAGQSTTNVVTVRSIGGQAIGRPGHATATAVTLTGLGQTMWLGSDGDGWSVFADTPPLMAGPMPFFGVTDRLTGPPVSAAGGARYIINGTPSGAWATLGFADHDVAESDGNGSWVKYTPHAGWFAYVIDENLFTKFDGTTWDDQTGMAAPAATVLRRAVFEHRENNGVNGGTATPGAWTIRGLNTQVSNNITGVTFNATTGVITLPVDQFLVIVEQAFGTGVGVYQSRVNPSATGGGVAGDISALRSTSGVTVGAGGVAELATHRNTLTHAGAINVTTAGNFELQYYVSSAGTNGLGVASTEPANNVEVYARVTVISLSAQQGPPGSQGPQGPDGLDAAHPYTWNTATSGDPGAGAIRANNASLASATQIAVNDVDAAGAPMAAVIGSWDNSTSTVRATLQFAKEGATHNRAEFEITGAVVNNGSWWTIPVNHVSSNGTLSNGDSLALLVVRTGDKGDPGNDLTDPSGLTELAWTAAAVDDTAVVYDTSAGATKVVTLDEMVVRVDGLAALKASSYWNGAVRHLNDNLRSGTFRFRSGSQSATLVQSTLTSSSVDTTADEISFAAAHSMWTGQVVQTSTTKYGVSSRTLYWVRKVDADTLSLHPSRADAIANTNKTNLTADTGNIVLQWLTDWGQGMYVIPDGLPLDGSSGAWVREIDGVEVFPGWWGASASVTVDSTSAVQGAIDFARLNHNGSHYNYQVSGLGASFRVSNIDMTNVRSPGWFFRDMNLVGYGAGHPTLDMSGLNGATIENVVIRGDQTDPPDFAFWLSRMQTDVAAILSYPSASWNSFIACRTAGYFRRSAFINFAGEVQSESMCDWDNRMRGQTPRAFVRCGDARAISNLWGSDSPSSFQTVPTASGTPTAVTHSNLSHSADRLNASRSADLTLAFTNISTTNPAVITVSTTTGITTGERVFFYNMATGGGGGVGSGFFDAFEGNSFVATVINGTTFSVPVDATALTGVPTGFVGNETGPAVTLQGVSYFGAPNRSYVLAYTTRAGIEIDVRLTQANRGINIWTHSEHNIGSVIDFVRDSGTGAVVQGLSLRTGHDSFKRGVLSCSGSLGGGSNKIRIDGCIIDCPGITTAGWPLIGMFADPAEWDIRGGDCRAPLPSFYSNIGSVTFKGRYWDPITNKTIYVGDGVQAQDDDLDQVAALAGTGLAVRTATTPTWTTRTITGTAAEITATNGDGVSGNPTLSLPTALTFTSKTITGGAYTGAIINNTTIGATTAAAGTFTTLTVNTNANPDTDDGAGLGTGSAGWSDLFLASGGVVNWANGDVTITHSADALAFAGAANGYAFSNRIAVTSSHANALAVGANGTTNPVLNINAATASVATGLQVTGAAAAGRVAVAAISSGTDEGLSLDAKGTGTIRLGATSTGAVEFSRNAVPTASDGAALGTTSLMWGDLFLASGGVINWNAGNATLTHSAGLLTSNVPISVGTSNAITAGTIELGHATDTTIARVSAGVISVEGETVHTNSTARTATASAIELGHATDTTVARSSAGVISVEGEVVHTNSTARTATAGTIELGHATDTTISRLQAGAIAVEGLGIPLTLVQSGVQVSTTSSTTETAVVTIAIPANIGNNSRLMLTALMSKDATYANNANVSVRFGATGSGTGGTQLFLVGTTSTQQQLHLAVEITNRNSASSQIASNAAAAGGWGASTAAPVTAAVNTGSTSEINLCWVNTNAADNGKTISVESYALMLFPKA